MDRLIKDRKPRNFPYIRCNVVLRKSRSRGSSLSNNSSNWGKLVSEVYLKNKFGINVGFRGGDVEIRGLDEAEKEFIDDL